MNRTYPCVVTITPEREREIEGILKSITKTVLDIARKIGHSIHITVHTYPDRDYAVPDATVYHEVNSQYTLYDTFGADTTNLFTKPKSGLTLKDQLGFTDEQVTEIAAKLNPALEELAKISIELDCTVSIHVTMVNHEHACEEIFVIPKECFRTKLSELDGFLAKSRVARERHWKHYE